jgi:hypothetical protein
MKTMKTSNKTIILLLWLAALPVSGFSHSADKPLRDFQFSVFPGVGTDGREAADHRYRTSINWFAGITGGIEGVELGGFLNITNGNIRGLQLSGFANLVNGHVQGSQFAGFANIVDGNHQGLTGSGFVNVVSGHRQGLTGAGFANVTGGHFQGLQGAGFANVVGGNNHGFQGAGFANVVGGNNQGFQGAGFANVVGGNNQGFQGAGFANIVRGTFQGFAGAGFLNKTGSNTQGFMAAGFANISEGDVQGSQIAGFMNISNNIKGIQAAGFLNIAGRVDGVQLGFINLADTISGVPIGFLSFVRKGGFKQIELSGSDMGLMSVSFRTGVPAFYNILSYNLRPLGDKTFNGFGYGMGTNIPFTHQFGMQLEAHSTQIREHWNWKRKELDILNEIRLSLGMQASASIEFFAGLVCYNQIYKDLPQQGITGMDIAPDRIFHERTWKDYSSRWWLGARGGLRFHLR